MPEPIGVLFVCLGNICRSPMAEAILRHRAAERGLSDRLRVDSCGTGGWHAGDEADSRAIACCRERGVPVTSIARQVDADRDRGFDLILAADASTRTRLLEIGLPRERIELIMHFAGTGEDVPDPYYGEDDGFTRVYEMLRQAADGLLDHLFPSG